MSLSIRNRLSGTNQSFAWAVEYILAYAERAGAHFHITSVNRTAQQQFELYRKANSLAVRPGCSQHEYGAAVDVWFERADWQRWWGQSARNFGLTTVPGDPVHAQLIPGGRFREWSTSHGLCPDLSFPSFPLRGGVIDSFCGPGFTRLEIRRGTVQCGPRDPFDLIFSE